MLNEIITTTSSTILWTGMCLTAGGVIGMTYMFFRSTRNVKNGKTTNIDVLYLDFSSPGMSRLSTLNSPDDSGLGIYLALALEQIGAIEDMGPRVEANLRVYARSPRAYLSAARYFALIKEKQKARDYLSLYRTLAATQKEIEDLPQLEVGVIEKLIESDGPLPKSKTSVSAIIMALKYKPHLLLLAASAWVFVTGACVLLLWLVMGIIAHQIA